MVLVQVDIKPEINKEVKQYMLTHDIDKKSDALALLIAEGLRSEQSAKGA